MTDEIVAEGLCNVESPTLGPDGWLLNVCSVSRPTEPWPTRGGDITATRIDTPRETHVLMSTSTETVVGIPAALAFGPDQAMYICDEGRRSIVRVGPDGSLCDFISEHEGRPLNGPNDLSFDLDGNLFFTDPWTSSPRNPIAAVYGYDWGSATLQLVDSGMQFTNGIVAASTTLYVAETYTRTIWSYDIVGAGRAKDRRRFCVLPDVVDPPLLPPAIREAVGVDFVVGPDGMCLDDAGNLYVAHYGGSGVYVYDPSGIEVGMIATPGRFPTNVCFGGADMRTLFISVDDPGIIIAVEPGARGRHVPFCPATVEDHAFRSLLDPTSGVKLPGRRW
jgi:sugar lactone lactonase YvrE